MTPARLDLVAYGDGARFQQGSTVKDGRGRPAVSACIDNAVRLRKTFGKLFATPLTAPLLISIAVRREVLRVIQLLLSGHRARTRSVIVILVHAPEHVREVRAGCSHRVIQPNNLILDALAPLDRESKQFLVSRGIPHHPDRGHGR